MKIGVPKEIKNNESRVAMTPEGVAKLVESGNSVSVEIDAGIGSGYSNEQYQKAGANLVTTAKAWHVDLVVKVKEPQKTEYHYLAKQIVFTFFHLAGVDKNLTLELIKNGTTAIAYESLEDKNGRLPILEPMSAIAGNMSVLMGAYYLASFNHGKGVQLGSVLNKAHGKVVIIGDGIVGTHAAKVASAMGAHVAIAGLDKEQWLKLNQQHMPLVSFFISNKENISKQIIEADLVIGAVHSRGAKAAKIVTEQMIKTMSAGSVLVDVSIDQGGCFETSEPTSHSDPVFIKHGIIHYCVSNMPGAYPKTATIALTDVTLKYIQDIAKNSLKGILSDKATIKGINIYKGKIVSEKVANDLNLIKLFEPLASSNL